MTTHRRALLAAVGAVAGTAGCLRLSGEETGTTDDGTAGSDAAVASTTATGEGAATADDATTTSEPSFPPYVDENGTSDALADVHQRVLWRTSYELAFRLVDVTDGRIQQAWRTRQADGVAVQEMQDGSRLAVFYGDDAPHWRQDVGDGYTYGQAREAAAPRDSLLTERHWVERFLRAGDWSSGTLLDDGTARVTASSAQWPKSLEPRFPVEEFRSFEGELQVRQDGSIASLSATFSFTSTLEDGVQRRRVALETANVGSTSVTRPNWLATARDRSPTVAVSLTEDASAVVVEQTGGNPMLPGSNVVLYDRENRRNAAFVELDEPVEQGDAVYVWFDDDGAALTRDPPSADAVARPVDGEYALWCLRSAVEYFGVADVPRPRVAPRDHDRSPPPTHPNNKGTSGVPFR